MAPNSAHAGSERLAVTYRQIAQMGWTLALLTLWGGLTATLRLGPALGLLALCDMYWRCARIALLTGLVLL